MNQSHDFQKVNTVFGEDIYICNDCKQEFHYEPEGDEKIEDAAKRQKASETCPGYNVKLCKTCQREPRRAGSAYGKRCGKEYHAQKGK